MQLSTAPSWNMLRWKAQRSCVALNIFDLTSWDSIYLTFFTTSCLRADMRHSKAPCMWHIVGLLIRCTTLLMLTGYRLKQSLKAVKRISIILIKAPWSGFSLWKTKHYLETSSCYSFIGIIDIYTTKIWNADSKKKQQLPCVPIFDHIVLYFWQWYEKTISTSTHQRYSRLHVILDVCHVLFLVETCLLQFVVKDDVNAWDGAGLSALYHLLSRSVGAY